MSATVDLFTELARSRAHRATSGRSPTGSRPSSAALGLEVEEDDAGPHRLERREPLCRLPGTADGGTPIFFCAHLDTVPPQGALEPVVADGVVRNAGGNDPRRGQQVGGRRDDRGGAAARRRRAGRMPAWSSSSPRRRRSGCSAPGAFDHTTLEAELGFVYDQAAPIGDVILGAPVPRTCGSASTADRPTRAWSRRRAAPRSPPRRARSPTSGSAGSTTRRLRTSA